MNVELATLKWVDEANKLDFRRRRCERKLLPRDPEFADGLKKMLEETGELIKAVKFNNETGQGAENVLDEHADVIVTAISLGFRLGLTFEDMDAAWDRCMKKILDRAKKYRSAEGD